MHHEAALQDVKEQSRPGNRAELQQQVEALRRAGGTSYGGLLAIPLDTDRSEDLRRSACWFLGRLGRLGRANAIPVLLHAAGDNRPAIRVVRVQALGMLGDPRILPQIIHALEADGDARFRQTAAYALGMLGDTRAATALVQVLSKQDEDPAVRGMPPDQLGTLGNSAAPALIAALQDAEAEVWFWSVFALGKLLDRRALPELRRLAREDAGAVPSGTVKAVPSGTVKEEAIDAIHYIETGEFYYLGRVLAAVALGQRRVASGVVSVWRTVVEAIRWYRGTSRVANVLIAFVASVLPGII